MLKGVATKPRAFQKSAGAASTRNPFLLWTQATCKPLDPIVGVVMGVLTYLMVVTGLLVFAGSVSPKSPELLQVLAFVGSFSDTLSINLLQRILGQFQTIGKGGKSQEQKAEGSIDRSKQES
jgi:hypothetical protein